MLLPRRFCPRKAGLIVVNDVTGEDLLARCGRNGCGYCGPWKADQIAKAIAMSRPRHEIVVTRAGSTASEIGARIHRAVSQIRASGCRFEYVFVIEWKDEAFHAHIGQHGDPIRGRVLEGAFRRQGTGLVLWKHVGSPDGFGRYMMKRPRAGLNLSVPVAAELMLEHLNENGQRMVHGSRGFWRDERGTPLGGLRAALAYLQRTRTPPGSRWRIRPLPVQEVPALPDLSTYRVSLPADE
jgi:hypothetical protein